jgi:hypothetical protein
MDNTEKYNANTVVTEKYYYGDINAIINFENPTDMGLNILSDTLARVLDVPNETKCVALNLNVSKNYITNKLVLNGIKFSPKKGENNEDTITKFRRRIIDVIEYCFGRNNFGDDNFTFKDKKLKILNQIKELLDRADIHERELISNKIFNAGSLTLDDFMVYLTDTIHINNEDTFERKYTLHSLLNTLFDIQILREIFSRKFEISNEFKENIQILLPAENIHAELQLATQLTKNAYIGISITCCPECSYVLHKYELDFRGSNSKKDPNWMNHPELHVLQVNAKKIDLFKNGLPNLRQKLSDRCQLVYKGRSNDMCHYLNFYQEILDNSQDTLKCLEKIKRITDNLSNHHCQINKNNKTIRPKSC